MSERTYKCPECYGFGIDDDFSDGKCRECLGTGRLTESELRSLFPSHVAEAVIQRANAGREQGRKESSR
jgi:DnaJ-class molecular chaperone